MTDDEEQKLDIDWTRTIAGALAAVSTAVLLSTLGAAGTLIGAAVGSVAATVGTALYNQGLARSRRRVREVALQKVGVAQTEARRAARRLDENRTGSQDAAEAHIQASVDRMREASGHLHELQEPAPGWGERLKMLPWKRIAVAAGAAFVVAVAVISAFELLGGKPVSSYTGGTDGSDGTSITRITGGGGGGGQQQEDPGPRDPDAPAPDDEGPRPSAPSEQPAQETPTEAPSEEPSEEPTELPTEETSTPPVETVPSPPTTP